ncbi:MAG: DEAD/DEAH box helicase [Planctomycetota bacterium]
MSTTATLLDPRFLTETPAFRALVGRLELDRAISVGGLWGSSQALLLAALIDRAQGPWLIVVSSDAEAELAQDDLAAFDVAATLLPARIERGGRAGVDLDSVRARLKVAQELTGPPERRPRVLIATIASLLDPIPSPEKLSGDYLHLSRGNKLDVEALLDRLVHAGYTRVPLAEAPGELSLRGDIFDLFTFAADLPVRVELFDDEIESIRTFDPETQRSVESLDRTALLIAADAGGVTDGQGIPPLSILPATMVIVELEPLRIEDVAEGLRVRSTAHARGLVELRTGFRERQRLQLSSLPGETINFETKSIQSFALGVDQAAEALAKVSGEGENVFVFANDAAEAERWEKRFAKHTPRPEIVTGSLSKGFRIPATQLVAIAHREVLGILGARGRQRTQKEQHKVRALENFFELKVGDLVVHAVHGLARFVGLEAIARAGGEEEHLELVFAEDVRVFVPVSRIDLVQRYIGAGANAPQLDKVGGQAFRKRKEKVERALIDLAGDLLEVQAQRELRRRDPWRVDAELMHDLVEAFPHIDTPDQEKTDLEIHDDLTSEQPMDRLLCGDVGFGKTELAVRAAVRVATGGGQVAVLVPTTVLAEQHGKTFAKRLAGLPVTVETISRYRTGKLAKEVLNRVATGQTDILIGTHRILSKDVAFKRLGMLIIDEEQRFGVTHKEHFKRLRAEIDVLTLSATPIPRTLHMSLSGLRDISALTMPPAGRQEIATELRWSQELDKLREALLFEKARGGQVFFLHNRVQSIERRARELQTLVPELTFAIGHGQMTGRELSAVMQTFESGQVDCLVATTIIENGVDIPSAGTILIDDAEMFGLAELHQLRGRVGRGSQKAACYLLLDKTKPMRKIARERLAALEELTQLGAGFQISMKDLELRGAGNLLGPEQSGHIGAVGYDMYCRLLKQTVERLQYEGGDVDALAKSVPAAVTAEIEMHAVELELGVRTLVPADWIPKADERLDLLRELGKIGTDADAKDALAMLKDRFGRVPEDATNLVRLFRLRARLAELGVRRLLWRDDTYVIEFTDRVTLEAAFNSKVELRVLRAGIAHLVIPPKARGAAAKALTWIETLFR